MPDERPEVQAAIDSAKVARGGHSVDATLAPIDVDPRTAATELLDTVTALTVVIESQQERTPDLEAQPTERLRVTPPHTPLNRGEI